MKITEEQVSGYAARTKTNVKMADLTVAIATDFRSRGELLTKKLAGAKYLAIKFGTPAKEAVKVILEYMKQHEVLVINVAGNGIYTLHKEGIDQHKCNVYVYRILRLLQKSRPDIEIRSGGQTGIDIAAAIACYVLNIKCTVHYPKGFMFRDMEGQDRFASTDIIKKFIRSQAMLV